MSDRMKDFALNLGCGAVIAMLVFTLSYSRRNSFILDNGPLSIFLHCLCDGLFVAAVMLLGTGGLKAVRNQGMFDVIGYGMKYVIETVIPALKSVEEENLYSYRERREASRKSAKGILSAGVVYFMLSIVVMLIYYFIR